MRWSFEPRLGGVALLSGVFAAPVMAACNNTSPASNITVSCTGSTTTAVVAQTGSTNVAINLDATAAGNLSRTTAPVLISVDHSSTIINSGQLGFSGGGGTGTVRGAMLLGVGDSNQLTNTASGVLVSSGAYNDGMAANGAGNMLTNNGRISTAGPNAYGMTATWGQSSAGQPNNVLINTGNVSTSGSNARAASILGGSGTINNSGMLSTTGASSTTAYLQGNNDQLTNTGTITASGASSDAVFSNTAGSSFTALIENQSGGQIISQNGSGIRTLNGNTTVINAGLVQSGVGTAISMGNGNNALILQTGSVINGTADGGAGTNTVTLQGTGTASNVFIRFQTLLMQGTQWDWTGSGSFIFAQVQSGTLNLLGTLGTTTTAQVDAGATLQATAQSLPQNVADNGLVRFAQVSDGTYAGTISGSGSVEKTGTGILTLSPATAAGNSYTGGTRIAGGTVAVAADNALGAASGALTLDGGTLQLNQSFDLSSTRAVSINAGGGTMDTQAFCSTLAQGVAGTGSLTKAGAGSLLMNGISTYGGGTNVSAGSLVVGDDAHTTAAIAGGGATLITQGATLGGYGNVSGTVTNNGVIAVANAASGLSAAANGRFTINGTLLNAGLVQVAGQGVGNQLIVNGSYVGQNATLALNTVVAQDGSASDRMLINGGTGSGTTTLKITNIGGTGAQTVADGIQLIQAGNGATTTTSAFTLAGPVKAGAFSYYLAKGGVTPGTTDNWYLRNTVAPLPAPIAPLAPTTPTTPTSPPVTSTEEAGIPVAAAGSGPLPVAPPAGSAPVVLYRSEVPIYAAMPSVARQLGALQLDTFHERQGDQSLLTAGSNWPAAWGRIWGGHSDTHQDGTVDQGFDGSVYGAQVGQDFYADTTDNGTRNHYGVLAGIARASGDIDGFASGVQGLSVGRLAVKAYSLGGYWTQTRDSGGYIDAVLQGSSFSFDPLSRDGVSSSSHGHGISGSLEGGMPFKLSESNVVEPQAQLIWQHLSLNNFDDGISGIAFNSGKTFLARLGLRWQGRLAGAGADWQPWLRLNILDSFGSDDKTTFGDNTEISSTTGQTSGQLGAGLTGQMGKSTRVYATVSWLANLGGAHQRLVMGNAGVRQDW